MNLLNYEYGSLEEETKIYSSVDVDCYVTIGRCILIVFLYTFYEI